MSEPATVLEPEASKTIRPLQDRLVVRHAENMKVSEGGIHLPDTGIPFDLGIHATVLSAGPDVTNDVQVGDEIFLSRNKGTKISIDGVELRIIREEDILGVFYE